MDLGNFGGSPWAFRGHSVVKADVADFQGVSQPPLFFCMRCGASVGKQVRPGKGLAANCLGARHDGLRTQRSRLRRRLHPCLGPPPAIDNFRGPQEADVEWLLGKLLAARGEDEHSSGARSVCARYGIRVPILDSYQVARLHGFESPAAPVVWARQRKAAAEVEESRWPLPDEQHG